eukprot:GEMP01092527.1.p2 GENE.GEMP01092527.1~~GEMP01092527.1.p2  ORF type:complete len:100 (+),score=6.20 GEMP01092527.1:394-693(+)
MTISGTSLHRKSDNEWRFVRDLQNVAPKTTYGFCAFPWAAGTGSGGYVANIDSEHTTICTACFFLTIKTIYLRIRSWNDPSHAFIFKIWRWIVFLNWAT